MTTTPEAPTCPECGQPGIPIVYGYPSGEMFEAAEAGRIALGGCIISEEMPTWSCSARHKWADESRPRMDGIAFVGFGGQRTNVDGGALDDSSE